MTDVVYRAERDVLSEGEHRFTTTRDGRTLTFAEAIDLWQHDDAFRDFFSALLADAPFATLRWETPPLTKQTIHRDFEFVLIEDGALARTADPSAFGEHFSNRDEQHGIAVFQNLGRDAWLVVPTPRAPEECYAHLAAFVRGAPAEQKHALWQVIGKSAERRISSEALWLNTAGLGVAWLHVRLDTRPKYYVHTPYKMVPPA